MEILLQIILEPLFFAYFDLVESCIDGARLKKWQEYLLKISCLVVSLISFLLILVGAFWVTDVEPFKTYGVIFLIIGIVVISVHILVGLFAATNHFNEEEMEEECTYYEEVEEDNITPQIYYVDANNDDINL